MQLPFPLGFNDNIYHEGNISKMPDFDFFLFWNVKNVKADLMVNVKMATLSAKFVLKNTNKLYKAALLTRCYVQHFLSPYIDSEVNHKRHFIKISFINKGIEFIDLHSIFKYNSVISSLPNYFNNTETPIICYKYNKPIRSTIFNFNTIVNDLDIDSNTPAS